MSGATAEVLQEYLVKLGFQTDQISLKKFEDGMGKTGKSVLKIGMGVAGVVASVEAASAAFAYSMRKTFFAAELADTSVKKMQAMSYAGKQFGISGDSMASSIKGMAQALRLNPGLQGLVESFGIPVTGRDKADVMMDFVKAIKDMPEFVGNQYASMFGMDADTFHQVREHYDEIIAKRKELSQLQKESGIDIDKQKQNILAYTSAMDKLSARFDLFATTFLSSMSPVFAKTVTWLDNIIEGWTWAFTPVAEKKSAIAAIKAARHAGKQGAATTPQGDAAHALNQRILKGEQVDTNGQTVTATDSRSQFIKAAAVRLGVPENAVAAQLALETGAKGDKTIGAYNYGNIKAGKSWAGKSTSANVVEYDRNGKAGKEGAKFRAYDDANSAAQDYADMIKRRFPKAVGARNATDFAQGLKDGGYATDPDYVKKITGVATRLGSGSNPVVTQNNTTNINVTGTGAEATAKEVARLQSRVNADAVRTLKSSTS